MSHSQGRCSQAILGLCLAWCLMLAAPSVRGATCVSDPAIIAPADIAFVGALSGVSPLGGQATFAVHEVWTTGNVAPIVVVKASPRLVLGLRPRRVPGHCHGGRRQHPTRRRRMPSIGPVERVICRHPANYRPPAAGGCERGRRPAGGDALPDRRGHAAGRRLGVRLQANSRPWRMRTTSTKV